MAKYSDKIKIFYVQIIVDSIVRVKNENHSSVKIGKYLYPKEIATFYFYDNTFYNNWWLNYCMIE